MTDYQKEILWTVVLNGAPGVPEWDVLCLLHYEAEKALPAFRRTIRAMEKAGFLTISQDDAGGLLLSSTLQARQTIGYPPLGECQVCLLRKLLNGIVSDDPCTHHVYAEMANGGLVVGSFHTGHRITDFGREAFALATSQIAVDSAEMPEGKDQC